MKTSVRCVDLTLTEVDYLKTADLLSPALFECLKSVRWRSGTVGTLEVSAATAEEFREAFTERLAKVGFDESYEPTAEGKLLEDLIDRFHEGP
jgi:hypothetical protein